MAALRIPTPRLIARATPTMRRGPLGLAQPRGPSRRVQHPAGRNVPGEPDGRPPRRPIGLHSRVGTRARPQGAAGRAPLPALRDGAQRSVARPRRPLNPRRSRGESAADGRSSRSERSLALPPAAGRRLRFLRLHTTHAITSSTTIRRGSATSTACPSLADPASSIQAAATCAWRLRQLVVDEYMSARRSAVPPTNPPEFQPQGLGNGVVQRAVIRALAEAGRVLDVRDQSALSGAG